jgi:serine phosphatase RsbU (regulator of sigma subunit)
LTRQPDPGREFVNGVNAVERPSGYLAALRLIGEGADVDIHQVLATACVPVPAWDPVVYLADLSRLVLSPLIRGVGNEDVAGTLAGRVFTTGQPVTSQRGDAIRVWVPVIEQTTRTGVLAVTIPDDSAEVLGQAELLGVFAGLVIAAVARVSDIKYEWQRGQAMSLPASMQWDQLPPLSTRVPGASIAGILEPAYDIAGDAFDYAVGHGELNFSIFDAMGHGIDSTLLSGLAIGACRHARREGAPLHGIHAAIDHALANRYTDLSFATGVIARLAIATGRLEWTCAGHPPPLLLRGRKVVGELACDPALPFGLGDDIPQQCENDLEPGDSVLLYTDGMTEARTPDGELFGLERLADLLEREAASEQPPEELVRRLVVAVLEHQAGGLRDDATLLLVQWTGQP